MTTIDSVTITTNDPKHGMHRVKVGDLDISNATTGAVISIKPGELPAVTVDLMVWEAPAPVDGPAEVTVPDDTASALVALGWTPPAPAAELTPEQAEAERIIRSAVEDIEMLTIAEMAAADTDPDRIDDLIRSATVTVTWPQDAEQAGDA